MLLLSFCFSPSDVALKLVICNLVKKQVDFLKWCHYLLFVVLEFISYILKHKLAIVRLILIFLNLSFFISCLTHLKNKFGSLIWFFRFCVILKTHLFFAFRSRFLMNLRVNRPNFLSFLLLDWRLGILL